MSRADPPRVAAALLRRFVTDNEPLVGDLLEQFGDRPSRLWFWRQVLLAIAIRSLQPRDTESPLGLVDHASFVPAEPRQDVEPRRINLTASPLPDVGGLGLVAFGVLIAVARPEAIWIFLPGIVAGVALGLTMAIVRRRAVLLGPPGARRTLLHDCADREMPPP